MKEIPAIIMENISKSFGAVKANEDVSLTVNNGEIHALLGENGAGKSTLMNMLSGIYNPDSGSVFIFALFFERAFLRNGLPHFLLNRAWNGAIPKCGMTETKCSSISAEMDYLKLYFSKISFSSSVI